MERSDENQLFASLSADTRQAWRKQAFRRTVQEGELFAVHGQPWPYLFLVESGTVHAVKESVEGRRLHVLTLAPGDVFWGMAFFHDDAPMPVTLEAASQSQLSLWSRERLLPLLLENSTALWKLTRLMVTRMTRASIILEDLAFQPVAGRLAGLLLEHYGGTRDTPVARDLTLDEMAERIGTTREMVCRALYNFSDEALIEITRTQFTLTDTDGLARLAGRA